MEELGAALRQPQQCVHCRDIFCEHESMGANQCRRHLGELQTMFARRPGGRLGTWTCCGAAVEPEHPAWRGAEAALGCTAVDHTNELGLPRDETLSYERALVLFGGDALAARNIHLEATRGEITIRRVASSDVR